MSDFPPGFYFASLEAIKTTSLEMLSVFQHTSISPRIVLHSDTNIELRKCEICLIRNFSSVLVFTPPECEHRHISSPLNFPVNTNTTMHLDICYFIATKAKSTVVTEAEAFNTISPLELTTKRDG
jgi:hypothetical protein